MIFGIYNKWKDLNEGKIIQITNDFDMTLKNVMILAKRMF